MGKTRVYKLARELDMESKELVEILQELGLEITSHMSTVDDETSQLVKDMLSEEGKEDIEDGKKIEKIEATDEVEEEVREIETPITVKELAETVDKSANEVIKMLMDEGVMASLNQKLDADSIELLADELNITVEIDTETEEKTEDDFKKIIGPQIEDRPEDLEPRPPIITVMGHVDHGKTTLLDVIRKTRVAENEAGGITQHIGAYQVTVNGEKISFIDTPGHEAFTEMRARGAKVTDIVILVVAADDGVMPQTEEAIHHAQAAEIPIVVAINKIDKPNAQPDRVKQELTEHGLVPEEWGGSTICVPISALQEENIDELLEMVLLVAEMQEIKANPDRPAEGIVVEAELDKGKGPIATVLVKNGTLRVGDPLICGHTYGRVRAMQDETGKRVEEATPSTPVVVLGFSDVPQAGDYVQVLEDERLARDTAEERKQRKHKKEIAQDTTVSLEDLYDRIQHGELKELNVIIKGDVQGSIEALKGSLSKLGTDEVSINIMHTGVGA
ncbi:MAG: translation initiation factor IF-2, partial [Halanaerobiales bacterium]